MNTFRFTDSTFFHVYSLWTLPVAQLKITKGRYKNTYIYYLLYKIEYTVQYTCAIREMSHLYNSWHNTRTNSWHLTLVQFVTSHARTIRDIPRLYKFVTSHTTIRDTSCFLQFVTPHSAQIRDISRLYSSWHLILVQFVTLHTCTNSWYLTLVQFVSSHACTNSWHVMLVQICDISHLYHSWHLTISVYMHLILSLNITYLNAQGWSAGRKHVAWVDWTDTECCGWEQYVCHLVTWPQRGAFNKCD